MNVTGLIVVGSVVGAGMALFEVHWDSYLQANAGEAYLARVLAVDAWLSFALRSIGFVTGVHACLGARLARREARAVISRVLSRLPDAELTTEEPTWRADLTLRGLDRLPVRGASSRAMAPGQ